MIFSVFFDFLCGVSIFVFFFLGWGTLFGGQTERVINEMRSSAQRGLVSLMFERERTFALLSMALGLVYNGLWALYFAEWYFRGETTMTFLNVLGVSTTSSHALFFLGLARDLSRSPSVGPAQGLVAPTFPEPTRMNVRLPPRKVVMCTRSVRAQMYIPSVTDAAYGALVAFRWVAIVTASLAYVAFVAGVIASLIDFVVAIVNVGLNWILDRIGVSPLRREGDRPVVVRANTVRIIENPNLVAQIKASEITDDVVQMMEGFVSQMREEVELLDGSCVAALREPVIAYFLAGISVVRDPSATTLALEVAKLVNHDAVFAKLDIGPTIAAIKGVMVAQGDEPGLATASIHNNPLAKAAYDVLTTLSIVGIAGQLGLVERATLWAIRSKLRDLAPAATMDEFAVKIVAFFSVLLKKLHECATEGSFAPLFKSELTFEQWHEICHAALYDISIRSSSSPAFFRKSKSDGSLPPFFQKQLNDHDRVQLYRALYAAGEVYQTAGGGGIQPSSLMGAHAQAREMRGKLLKARVDLEASLSASQVRPVPFGLYLFGAPGVGKSTLLDPIAQLVADQAGALNKQDIRYDFSRTKHMDGVTASKLMLVLDDPDQNKVSTPAFDDTTWAQLIINAINSTPFMAVMAAVEDKGSVWLRPEFIAMTSNQTPSMHNVQRLGADPGAVYRRFKYFVEMSVAREKDRTATGTLADGVIFNDTTWHFDVHVLNVDKDFTDPNDHSKLLRPFRLFTSRLEFLIWLRSVYSQHRTKAELVAAESLGLELDASCRTCGMRSSIHFGFVDWGCAYAPKPDFTAALPLLPEVVTEEEAQRRSELREEDFYHPPAIVAQLGESPPPRELTVEEEKAALQERIWSGASASLKAAGFFWGLFTLSCIFGGYWGALTLQFVALAGFLGIASSDGAIRNLLLYGAGGKRLVLAAAVVRMVKEKAPAAQIAWFARHQEILERLKACSPWLKWVAVGVAALVPILCIYLSRIRKALVPQNLLVGVGPEPKVVPVQPTRGFIKLPKLSSFPSAPSQGMSTKDFYQFLNNSMARVTNSKGGSTWAFYLGGHCWWVNKHCVVELPAPGIHARTRGCEKLTASLTFDHFGTKTTVVITEKNTALDPQRDSAVVCCPAVVPRSAGVLKLIPPASMSSVGRFGAVVLMGQSADWEPQPTLVDKPVYARMSFTNTGMMFNSGPYLISYKGGTVYGDCGRCLVAKSSNGEFLIVGAHAFGDADASGGGYAEELIRTEIESLMGQVQVVGLVPQAKMTPTAYALLDPRKAWQGSEAVLKPIPELRSGVAQAWKIKPIFQPIGTVPKWHNSSMASKFVPTPIRDAVLAIARDEGIDLRVALPTFGGQMADMEVDGEMVKVWQCCTTHSLLSCSNKEGPEDLLDWALKDYLKTTEVGMRERLRGVRPLEWYEVFRGDEEQMFNPKDLDTSTGPPFNTQKRHHIKFHPDGEVEVRDTYLQDVLDMESAMLNDPSLVFMPTVKASEKDEPLAEDKVLENNIRMFFTCQDTFNSLAKKYVGPILVRASTLSECEMAIGMNIAGPALDAEQNERAQYDPERIREMAADYKKYDKRQSNQLMRYCNAVVEEWSMWTAYTPEEKSITKRLLFGAMYALIVIKGDVIVCGFQLLSGIWWTAHMNSILNSLLYRASFRRANPLFEGSFRSVVYAKFLGDDNRASVKPQEGFAFNQLILREGVAEYGMILTSCNKASELGEFTPASESTFLKRHFSHDYDSGRWYAPLEMKSILKMLCFVKLPKYGLLEDQVATNVFNAAAELYLHGRETYDRLVGRIWAVLPAEVANSPILAKVSYERFHKRFLAGEDIWTIDPPVVIVDPSFVAQMGHGETVSEVSVELQLDQLIGWLKSAFDACSYQDHSLYDECVEEVLLEYPQAPSDPLFKHCLTYEEARLSWYASTRGLLLPEGFLYHREEFGERWEDDIMDIEPASAEDMESFEWYGERLVAQSEGEQAQDEAELTWVADGLYRGGRDAGIAHVSEADMMLEELRVSFWNGREDYERCVADILDLFPELCEDPDFRWRWSYEHAWVEHASELLEWKMRSGYEGDMGKLLEILATSVDRARVMLDLEVQSVDPRSLVAQSGQLGVDASVGTMDISADGATSVNPSTTSSTNVGTAATSTMGGDPLDAILFKPVRAGTAALSTGDTIGNAVFAFTPVITLLSSPAIAAKLRNYNGWRGNIRMAFEMSSAGSNFGAYLVAVDPGPTSGPDAIAPPAMTYPQAFQAKNRAWLMAAQGGITEIVVPWVYCYDRASVDSSSIYLPKMTVRIYCASPLTNAFDTSLSATASVTAYVAFERDLQLFGVVPQMMGRGAISGALRMGASIAGALSTVPVVAPYSVPIGVGLSAASGVAAALGHTRDQAQRQTMLMRTVGTQPVGPGAGEDMSTPSALTNSAMSSTDPRLGGGSDGEDECAFASILRRPGLVGMYVWSSSAAVGSVIASIPVTPGLSYLHSDTLWYPTPSAFVGAPLAFWRGSMRYTIKTNHPSLSGGAYVVMWTKLPYAIGSSLPFDPTSSTYSCVVDLGPVTERTFEVGWASNHNVGQMRVCINGSTMREQEVNGYLTIAVAAVMSVVKPTAAPNATLIITSSCGDDMAYGGSRPFAAQPTPLPLEPLLIVAQTTATQQPVSDEVCLLTAVGASGASLVSSQFAEPILSARALMQKFMFCGNFFANGTSPGAMATYSSIWPCYPTPLCSGAATWTGSSQSAENVNMTTGVFAYRTTSPSFNWIGWLRCAYVGIRGGTLIKAVSRNGINIDTSWWRANGYEGAAYGAFTGANWFGTAAAVGPFEQTWGATMFNATAQASGEFYVPYVSSRLFWPACGRVTGGDLVERRILLTTRVVSFAGTPACNYDAWIAGAADINLIHWRCAPAISAPGAGVAALVIDETEQRQNIAPGNEEFGPMDRAMIGEESEPLIEAGFADEESVL